MTRSQWITVSKINSLFQPTPVSTNPGLHYPYNQISVGSGPPDPHMGSASMD